MGKLGSPYPLLLGGDGAHPFIFHIFFVNLDITQTVKPPTYFLLIHEKYLITNNKLCIGALLLKREVMNPIAVLGVQK